MSFLAKTIKYERTKLVIIMVISFLLLSGSTTAEVLISETFDTGLSSDWTITHGSAEVQDGVLVGTECFDFGRLGASNGCGASLWLNNTAMTGTWSLDFYLSNENSSFFMFFFIGEGNSSTTGGWPNSDYTLFIFGSDYQVGNIHLGYHHHDGDGWRDKLDYELTVGWMHLDVSRNNTGFITLYIDRLEVFTFNHISPVNNQAEHMNFQLSVGDKLDNITYRDTVGLPDLTPTASIDPPTPINTSSNTPSANIIDTPPSNTSESFVTVGLIGTSGLAMMIILKKTRFTDSKYDGV